MAKVNVIAEPNTHEVTVTREFNAPKELIFKVLTDPALVPQWWGPSSLTTVVDAMDVKMGGMWRYVQQDADGNEYAFRGVYHHIQPSEQMVYTFEWEGMPGHIVLETISLTEQDGKTLLTDSSVFQSVSDRDGMLQNGMEEGASESWDRLEALLQTA